MTDRNDKPAVALGPRIVASGGFTMLYKEGMSLIEDVAAYLDGDGRTESRGLPREASFVYATESMRHTTRLMQHGCSWLRCCSAPSTSWASSPPKTPASRRKR